MRGRSAGWKEVIANSRVDLKVTREVLRRFVSLLEELIELRSRDRLTDQATSQIVIDVTSTIAKLGISG
jgi:hypothetical protein